MNDLIEKLSDLRSQFNCFNENEREVYHTLSEAIKVISERPEPREDDKHCSNCIYSGRPTYKSPCSECRDNSQWEMKPILRSHENSTECEGTISRQAAIGIVRFECGEWKGLSKTIENGLNRLPSAQLEPCEDAVSRRILLNDLKELITAWEKYPVMAEQIKGVETAIGYVKTIPSVTLKRKE